MLVSSDLIANYFANINVGINFDYLIDEQIIRESRYIGRGQLCPSDPENRLVDRLGSLNVPELRRLMTERFYDPQVMRNALCVISAIFYSSEDDDNNEVSKRRRIKMWIRNLKRIGAESVYGYAFRGYLEGNVTQRQEDAIFVIKVPRDPKNDLLHELFIGLHLNRLRRLTPNFVYTFGGFKCSYPFIDNGNNVVAWCNSERVATVNYVLNETILPSLSFREYTVRSSFQSWLSKYLQVLYALSIANRELGFTHYDLHYENVLVKSPEKLYSIPYVVEGRREYINSDGIAMIIDFGRSNINLIGYNYGAYNLREIGVQVDTFPLTDAYKLLMFSMSEMNEDNFNEAAEILKFFTDEEPRAFVSQQRNNNYVLPYFTSLKTIPLTSLINYIKTILPVYIKDIITSLPKYELASCAGLCLTDDQVKTTINVNTISADTIFEFYDVMLRLQNQDNKENEINLLRESFHPYHKDAIAKANDQYKNIVVEIQTILNTFPKGVIITDKKLIELFSNALLNDYRRYVTEAAKLYDLLEELSMYKDAIIYVLQFYVENIDFFKSELQNVYSTLTNAILTFIGKIVNKITIDSEFIETFRNNSDTNLYLRTNLKFSWWWLDLPLFVQILSDIAQF